MNNHNIKFNLSSIVEADAKILKIEAEIKTLNSEKEDLLSDNHSRNCILNNSNLDTKFPIQLEIDDENYLFVKDNGTVIYDKLSNFNSLK